MTKNRKDFFIKGLSIIFWIIIWQIASKRINENMILASPLKVFNEILNSLFEKSFWERVIFSYFRIMTGFFYAISLGIVAASLSYKFKIINILLNPLISIIKSVPTAAIIILFLIWTKVENLSVMIAFFMTFPIIYVNILKGL